MATAKQLAWRKKFAKMAKSGAFRKAIKKNPPGRKTTAKKNSVVRKPAAKRPATRKANPKRASSKKPVSVRRNGKKLYGAAAQAVLKSRAKKSNPKRRVATRRKNSLHKDAGHTIAVRKYFRSGGRLTSWKDAEKRGQQRLFSMNPPRRRNSATGDLYNDFQGRASKQDLNVFVPNNAPRDLYALGGLKTLVTVSETFGFDDGEAYLAADKKGKVHVAGDVRVEPNTDFGELLELSYTTVKEHINPGQEVEYYHELGEEGGELPHLQSDDEGLFHIVGGDYFISPDGIVN